MKLYHFLPQQWALQAIKNQRIKVSNFNALNDPFELLAISLEDTSTREALKKTKDKLNDETRLLCFSKNWQNSLLWAHYADKHKGIALEFEVPEKLAHSIKYKKQRIKLDVRKVANNINDSEKTLLWEAFCTKSKDWSYEEEYRMLYDINELLIDNDVEFIKFNYSLKITRVFLGALCNAKDDEIAKNIPRRTSLQVIRTRAAFRSFKIVRNKMAPVIMIDGKFQ